jgi:GT2 family glycosyltransferase
MKSITIVIPNYNGMRYLEGCLNSLAWQSDRDFEIVMIDNASTDGSVGWVRRHYPDVRIRAYHRNTGFCRAVNAGISMSRGKYVLLLNNDVVCDPEMVSSLRSAMDSRPQAFSCCAKLLQMSDPSKIDDAGDFYNVFGWAFARGKGKSSARYTEPEKVFACCAAAAIYRKSVFSRIGLFDERHFAYLEDIDVGYRAMRHGYENWYIPQAIVRHAGSATSGSRHNAFKVRLAARNSVWLVKKNMPPAQIVFNLPYLAAGCAVKWGYFLRKGLGKEYAEGILEGLGGAAAMEGAKAVQAGTDLRAQLWLWRGVFVQIFEFLSR